MSFNLPTAITIKKHQLMLTYKGILTGVPITATLVPKPFKVINVLHWIPSTLIIILPFAESVANLPLIRKKLHIFSHSKIKSCAHKIYTKAFLCGSKGCFPPAHLICFLWSSLCCPQGHPHTGDKHVTCIANSLPPNLTSQYPEFSMSHNKMTYFYMRYTYC